MGKKMGKWRVYSGEKSWIPGSFATCCSTTLDICLGVMWSLIGQDGELKAGDKA